MSRPSSRLRFALAAAFLLALFAPAARAQDDSSVFAAPDVSTPAPQVQAPVINQDSGGNYTATEGDDANGTNASAESGAGGCQETGCNPGFTCDQQTGACTCSNPITGCVCTGSSCSNSGSAPSSGGINPTYLQAYAGSIIGIINFLVIPVLFAIAFFAFVYGVFNYFILGASDPEKRATGGQFVLWSLIGFAILVSVWGLVYVAINTLGFGAGGVAPPVPQL